MSSGDADGTQQLDDAILELDDIYKELKELKNESTSPNRSNTTPRSHGRNKNSHNGSTASKKRTESETHYATTSKVPQRHTDSRRSNSGGQSTMTTFPADATLDSSYTGHDNKRFTLGEEIPFPPPPVNSPPPQDEYVIRQVAPGHSESDYDEVPSEDEFRDPKIASIMMDDEIPDYDEIPDEVQTTPSQQDGTYVSMETLPYPKARQSTHKESAFPMYSVVEKKTHASQNSAEKVTVQHLTNNSVSFYDNYRGDNKRETSFGKSQPNGTSHPETHNGVNKPSVTSREANDVDEWDDESVIDEHKEQTQTNGKTVSISMPKQSNGNAQQDDEIIDCTQKSGAHKDGEFLCCRLAMSIGVVLAVGLFIAIIITFIYYGIDLDRGGDVPTGAAAAPSTTGTPSIASTTGTSNTTEALGTTNSS